MLGRIKDAPKGACHVFTYRTSFMQFWDMGGKCNSKGLTGQGQSGAMRGAQTAHARSVSDAYRCAFRWLPVKPVCRCRVNGMVPARSPLSCYLCVDWPVEYLVLRGFDGLWTDPGVCPALRRCTALRYECPTPGARIPGVGPQCHWLLSLLGLVQRRLHEPAGRRQRDQHHS